MFSTDTSDMQKNENLIGGLKMVYIATEKYFCVQNLDSGLNQAFFSPVTKNLSVNLT